MATRIPLALLATALACSLFAAPAHALRARVYVSKTGADVGTCSFSAPCQSLDFALNAVLPSGEITILDSGGYNPITITKGVTITVPPGVEAGIAAPAGGTAITIFATAGDAVILRGLTLAGSNSATFGIDAESAGKIEIIDCVVRDFSVAGIVIHNQLSTTMLAHILNTKVMNNANTGILIQGSSNSTYLMANLDHLTIGDNNGFGISIKNTVSAAIYDTDFGLNGIGTDGCNLRLDGGTIGLYADLKRVKLGEVDQCAYQVFGNSTVRLSESQGGFPREKGGYGTNLTSSDGTNIFQGPFPNVSAWTRQ